MEGAAARDNGAFRTRAASIHPYSDQPLAEKIEQVNALLLVGVQRSRVRVRGHDVPRPQACLRDALLPREDTPEDDTEAGKTQELSHDDEHLRPREQGGHGGCGASSLERFFQNSSMSHFADASKMVISWGFNER